MNLLLIAQNLQATALGGFAALVAILLFAGSSFVFGSTVFQGTLYHTLKKVLNSIMDDKTDGLESGLFMPKYFDVDTMDEAYIDDLELGGPGLATLKTEGAGMSVGTLKEGVVKRYLAQTFALKMAISEEAMDDSKYPEAIKLARRLKRAMYKTVEYTAGTFMGRIFNAATPAADGVAVCSAAHTLPNGGTFSNLMATPMSPSRAAMIIATTAIRKMVGHDGLIQGFSPQRILCPQDQWAAWAGVVDSKNAPEPGAFNEINVINRMSLEVEPNPFWFSSTTNWAVKTDVDNGLRWLWRKKPVSRTWTDNNLLVMLYGISARWDLGVSDPRGIFGVNA